MGWLSYFGDTLVSLLEFFKSALNGMLSVVKSFPAVFRLVNDAVSYLPSLFATFFVITVCISIVYLVVKFNAGG